MPETILQRLQAYQDKQDTPERLAMFQGVGEKYYADADFLNLLKEAIIELYAQGPSSIDQNNIGRVIATGYMVPSLNTTIKDHVVNRLNSLALTITEKQTPVVVTGVQLSASLTAQRFKYLFKPGKGTWGLGGTQVEGSHLELLIVENVQISDAGIDANTVTVSLGVLPDDNFLPALNSEERNFSAEHSEYQVNYIVGDKTYVLFFNGIKGIYGGSGTLFTLNQFTKLTDSDAVPQIAYTSQLTNNGDGVNPFVTIPFWEPGTHKIDAYVKKVINNALYLFRSKTDDNTTEPLFFSDKPAWAEYYLSGTYIGVWNAATTYVIGNIVARYGILYRCVNNNTNEDPALMLPQGWFKIGEYMGDYDPGTIYNNGQAVTDEDNKVYLSNYDKNNYALDYGIVSNWELINGNPIAVVKWGDSMTYGIGSTGNGNFPTQFSIASGLNIINKGVPGETSTQIKARFDASPELWPLAQVFWWGRNNPTQKELIKDQIADAVNKIGHDRYLVVGLIRNNGEGGTDVETLNLDLEAIYGDRYVDPWSYLFSLYNPEDADDAADHAAGRISRKFRSDWVHLTNLGYYHVSKAVLEKKNILLGEEYAIGFPAGSNVSLVPNGGKVSIGLIGSYFSGTVKRPVINEFGELVFAPAVPAGYVPFFNEAGNLAPSLLYYNSSGAMAVGTTTPEPGFIFQAEGAVRIGSSADISAYIGRLNATTMYIASRTTVAQNIQIFAKQLLFGTGLVSPTANGETAVFEGEIKVSPATLDTSAVTKGQMSTALAYKADLVGGVIPASQLPAYVDDVLEYSTYSSFPATGESGKIYIALDTNLSYRWGGSVYVEISPSIALGETSSTAHRGDHGKVAYVHSLITDGSNPHNTTIGNIPGLTAELDNTVKLSGGGLQIINSPVIVNDVFEANAIASPEIKVSNPGTDPDDVVRFDQVETVIRSTHTINFGFVPWCNTNTNTVTITGAVVGHDVAVIPPTTIGSVSTYDAMVFTGFVSAVNTVIIKAHNTSRVDITVPSGSFKVIVKK